MDTAQWPQRNIVVNGGGSVVKQLAVSDQKKAITRPQKEQAALNCPRCASTNTKFCYYNNYSLSQPRYFCKTCRRYWTEGGSLRTVPVGGGSRKNKRSSSSSSSSSSNIINNNNNNNGSKKPAHDDLVVVQPNFLPQNPKIHQGQDLNLVYNPSHYNGNFSEFVSSFPLRNDHHNILDSQNPNYPSSTNTNNSSTNFPVMELLKAGGGGGGLGCNLNPLFFSSSISGNFAAVHGLMKPNLGFSLDENGYGNLQLGDGAHQDPENSSKAMINFPFEEERLKPDDDRGGHQGELSHNIINGSYWNGMLGGGGGTW